tara:strand:+ start:1243 stop:1677 length:435 start_codon:yes stop_codon:yes gene_type:complete
MALSSASHEKFYTTSGSGADKVATKDLTDVTAAWAAETAEGCVKYIGDPILGPIVFQLQQMQDELDYLRTEISANKDKTGISSGQTSAITANTAKVALVGGSATALSFGEMITTTHGKGNPATYSIVMTAVKSGVTKTVTLTLT